MNELNFFESISPLAREFSLRLMFAMLHFLWQGSLIGILLAVAVRLLRSASAEMRYGTHVAALAALAVCLPLTFAIVPVPESARANPGPAIVTERGVAEPAGTRPLLSNAGPASGVTNEARKGSHGETVAFATPVTTTVINAAPCVAALYAFGVGLMLMRLSASLWGGHRLRAASEMVSDSDLLALVAAQARIIGLKSTPAVAWCERVAVPMVVGIVRPLVLLPCSLTTGLHRDQLAVIISHELAHIRRLDPVVNLFQRLTESLLFFHPAVWLVSRQISSERELCCDNLVVRSGYGPVQYAGALIRIAELYVAKARPALLPQVMALRASGDRRSELSRRVYRLLGATDSPKVGKRRSIALAGLLLVSVGAAMAAGPIEQPKTVQAYGEDASSEGGGLWHSVFTWVYQHQGDRAGIDALDYIRLHGSYATSPNSQEITRGEKITPSQVGSVHVRRDRFSDTMIDKLMHLPNLERVFLSAHPRTNAKYVPVPIEQIPTSASKDAIAKLRSRFPALETYNQL